MFNTYSLTFDLANQNRTVLRFAEDYIPAQNRAFNAELQKDGEQLEFVFFLSDMIAAGVLSEELTEDFDLMKVFIPTKCQILATIHYLTTGTTCDPDPQSDLMTDFRNDSLVYHPATSTAAILEGMVKRAYEAGLNELAYDLSNWFSFILGRIINGHKRSYLAYVEVYDPVPMKQPSVATIATVRRNKVNQLQFA